LDLSGDTSRVVRCLMNNSAIGTLSFSRINFNDRLKTALFYYLKLQTMHLPAVELYYCDGQLDDAIKLLLTGKIKSLKLDGDRTSFLALATGLAFTVSLQELVLPQIIWTEEYTVALTRGLQMNSSIQKLDLRKGSFAANAIDHLSRSLRNDRNLRSLILTECHLEDASVYKLVEALANHPLMEELNLESNFCRENGLRAVAQMIVSQKKLTTLLLGKQGLVQRSLDLSLLESSLGRSKTLKSLSLSYNTLTEDDMVSLANALKQNSTIQRLYLRCCSISDSVIQILAAALPEMKGLKFVDLVGNPFGQDGAKSFLAGLKENVHLSGVRLPVKYHNTDDIQYYLALNRGGRCLLSEVNFPASLWPLVLERSNRFVEQHHRADVHFQLLQGPILLDR
jgi:Ran GTPase-activating protein (RanGAP) involved in mRNA processing and transport